MDSANPLHKSFYPTKSFNKPLAIAIGINNYRNGIAELKTARPDAEKLADLLATDYNYQVELITDETDRKPTLTEIRTLLTQWLPQQLQPPAENNRLLFYFAGHGMPLESDDGPRGILLPQDADPKDSSSFLPMQELHDALIALPCHHLLIILDCCFAGTFRWSSTRKLIPVPETIHRQHYDRFIRYPAWQVIASSAHNQEALDFLSDKRGISEKDAQHSPFAEALFEALQDGEPDDKGKRYKKADLTKDGVITAPELYLYLRDNVETRSGERQTPGLFPLKKHDRGEYIFHDPKFDPTTLSEAPELDEANNPYRGLKPFEEQHSRFFFGRQELIEQLYTRIAAPDHSLTVVLGVSGSGKSSLVKAGLIPYLKRRSQPEEFAIHLVKACILTIAILQSFLCPPGRACFPLKFLPINYTHPWQILSPMRPGESPFASLARTVFSIADTPASSHLSQLGFLNELLQRRHKQLNDEINQATDQKKETSSKVNQLQREAKTFAQIIADWNDSSPLIKQRSLVEHFEILYALCQTEEQDSEQQQQLKQAFQDCLAPLTQQLRSDPGSLVAIAQEWAQNHPDQRLLLVIDQFEELITLGRTTLQNSQSDQPEEWQQFLNLLETTLAAQLPQLRIIFTLRSDFEPRFLNSEALKPYWSKARFPVRAMRSGELRQAIEGPASEMALYFEPANLVDRLIDEVGQMPGALPLLSFTLSELYVKLAEKWRNQETSDRALTIDVQFDQEGGVAGSLTRRANEEYQKIGQDPDLGETGQRSMRRVMLRMLTLEGGKTARRRVPDSELIYPTQEESDRVKQVVDRLVNARLLVRGQLENGEPYVEPAHDFLVRSWDKLQEWLKENQENITLQHRLAIAVTDWSNGRGILWFEDVDRLAKLEKVLDSEVENWLNRLEQEFVTQSILERQNRIKKLKEDLRISEERRLAAELELGSVTELRQFEIEKGIVSLQNATRIAHELMEWTQKNHRTLREYPTVSPLFTLQTILDRLYEHEYFFYSQETDMFWNWLTQNATPEVISAQFETGHGESLLIHSLNGQYFITIEAEVTQPNRFRWRIWQQPQEPLTDVLEADIEIDPAHFSRSGNIPRFSESGKIIVLKSFSVAEFYNLAGNLVGKFSASPGFLIEQITLSPDDSKIAIIERLDGGESTQRLHFMAQYRRTQETSRFQRDRYFYIDEVSFHRVYGLMRFTADSQFLVTANSQNTNVHPVRVWHLEPHICLKLADSEQLPTVPLQRNLEFRWQEGKAECLDQDQIIAVLEGQEDWFEQIILSPQQTWLISIDRTYSVRLWQRSGTLIGNFAPYRGASLGRQVVLSPRDEYCALVDRTGISIISLSDVLAKAQANPDHFLITGLPPLDEISISQIQGSWNQFSSLSFSPDEERIVAVGMERTIRVWDLKARQLAELNLTDPQIARIIGAPLDMGDGFGSISPLQ